MAREHAQFRLSMWADDDFRDLTRDEQHLYFVLVTHPSLSYCGVVDWRTARLAALASDWTREDVETTAKGLVAKRYIVVDDETEEVLVRSFIRNDEILKQPKVALAMLTAWAGVASKLLRGVVVHEIKRLHAESPTLPAFTSTATASGERLRDLLTKPGIDPSPNPSGNPSACPSGNPSGGPTPKGSGNPSGSPDPYPDPVPKIKTHAPTERVKPAAPSAQTALAVASDVNASHVVAAWTEACEANGVAPSTSQRAQVGKQARELLAKNDPAKVLEAAAVAGAKGYASIDRELTALNGRIVATRQQSTSTTDDRVAQVQALKRGNRTPEIPRSA